MTTVNGSATVGGVNYPVTAQVTLPTTTTPMPSWSPSGWNMIFDDEFTGSAVDESKWFTGWYSDNGPGPAAPQEMAAYSASHVSVSNGLLNLELTATPSSGQFGATAYTGACIMTYSKFSYAYGAMEVRANLPAYNGNEVANWPAIWSNSVVVPANGEIDILEGLGGSAEGHWHSQSADYGTPAVPNMTGWHTFGAQWDTNAVTFYYDGKQVGQATSGITGNPQYLVLTHTTTSDFGADIVAPATMQVDWCRVWQKA